MADMWLQTYFFFGGYILEVVAGLIALAYMVWTAVQMAQRGFFRNKRRGSKKK